LLIAIQREVWSIYFPVAVTSSFAFLVYYMRSERDRILTSSRQWIRTTRLGKSAAIVDEK